MINKSNKLALRLFFLVVLIICSRSTFSDVVKPALIEINVNTNQILKIEIRTSIEALLTGINSQYKNTKESPNAKTYDELRALSPEKLKVKFNTFHDKFKHQIKLYLDNNLANLSISSVKIPLPGYTKVPRTSIITLTGNIPRDTQKIYWHYPKKFGDNAVRVRQIDEENEKWYWSSWQWLRNGNISTEFSLSEVFTQQATHEIIYDYISAGFQHILPKGFDHILFILGIFLLSTHFRVLIWQVTIFTLAHTITLGLSMNGIISLPASIVEPLIALSIAYIAFENVIANSVVEHKNFKSYYLRFIIIFIFGLLHGLGFASMLNDFGMPKHAFYTALISFNFGVELGQLSIITIAYISLSLLIKEQLITNYLKLKSITYKYTINYPLSLLIGSIGLYLTIDRFDLGAINEVFS